MSDPLLFSAGGLFTTDYLLDAIRAAPEYLTVDAPALRARLRAIVDAFPRDHRPNEAQTEDDLIWPVLGALGWSESLRQQNLTAQGREDVPDGLLFLDPAAKARANAHPDEWRRYGEGAAAVESKRWSRPLDRAGRGDETATPSTQMLRYLRRIDDLTHGRLRWGILTNGAKWRLYWAGARSVSEEFLEIDLARVLGSDADLFAPDDEREHWLRVFAAMFGRAGFAASGADDTTFHARALRQSAFYEQRVAANLSRLVFEQVFPAIAAAIHAAEPQAPLQEVREAALVLLYRLLFLLYAEDRELLPIRDRRYDDYALRPLRQEVGRRVSEGDAFSATATRIWSQAADLSRMIDKGDPSVGLPPYNGGLFAGEGTPLLDRVRLPDSVMAATLDALSFERVGAERRYINYRDLSVQQLGSIYERLLEHELHTENGHLAVRPNAFARKNTGSYYTPDALVGLILDQTLEPLIAERRAAFTAALAALRPGDSEDARRRSLRAVDPAEAILGLRVLDPAMGSGHFLVSLVDTLTDHVLVAMAEVAAASASLDHRSPLAERIVTIRETILANAARAKWAIEEAQLDDRHIVRRMVLKRCVYGVDKNPMAVELAKVALWLHTFTVGAPLSFIDHHLRAGDSLFGLWVRDGVARARERGGGELLFSKPVREAQAAAAAMGVIERLTDAEIAEAHESAKTFIGVQSQTAPLGAFLSLVAALDWLEPLDPRARAAVRALLDGQFGDPVLIAEGRVTAYLEEGKTGEGERLRGQKNDTAELFATATALLTRARALIAEEGFLHWQVAFPGVWADWSSAERHGGFDAVVGNPPWDRFEFEEVPWFEARDRSITLETSGAKRKTRIKALRDRGDPLWREFEHASDRLNAATRMARSSGAFSKLNGGKLNLFKLFVERATQLCKTDGMVGLLVPSGISSDLSAAPFFREVAVGGHLKALFDFENRRTRYGVGPFFPDVDTRFKFSAFIASPTRTFPAATCAFFLQDTREIADPERGFPITAADFARLNPNTGTAPIVRSRRDMALTLAIYTRLPVLVDRSGGVSVAAWPVRYSQTINMTSASHLFRTRVEMEEREGAWPTGGNRFASPAGEWVPLYEGKMVQAFDHRAASVVVNAANVNRPAQPLPATDVQHGDPAWVADPQFWVQAPPGLGSHPYALGFKDVTAPTNVRSMIAAVVPSGAAGNTLPLIEFGGTHDAPAIALLAGNLNALVFDYVARQKIQGQHLNWFIVEQLPVVTPATYARAFGPRTAAEIVRAAVLELSYTAHDLAPFARDLGHLDADGAVLPPFVWDEERRLYLRAKLDALYLILYGIADPARAVESRDDVRHIFSTFPIVAREQNARWGRHRYLDLTLAWINALWAGQPDVEIKG